MRIAYRAHPAVEHRSIRGGAALAEDRLRVAGIGAGRAAWRRTSALNPPSHLPWRRLVIQARVRQILQYGNDDFGGGGPSAAPPDMARLLPFMKIMIVAIVIILAGMAIFLL